MILSLSRYAKDNENVRTHACNGWEISMHMPLQEYNATVDYNDVLANSGLTK